MSCSIIDFFHQHRRWFLVFDIALIVSLCFPEARNIIYIPVASTLIALIVLWNFPKIIEKLHSSRSTIDDISADTEYFVDNDINFSNQVIKILKHILANSYISDADVLEAFRRLRVSHVYLDKKIKLRYKNFFILIMSIIMSILVGVGIELIFFRTERFSKIEATLGVIPILSMWYNISQTYLSKVFIFFIKRNKYQQTQNLKKISQQNSFDEITQMKSPLTNQNKIKNSPSFGDLEMRILSREKDTQIPPLVL